MIIIQSIVTEGKLNKVATAEIKSILNKFEGKKVEITIKKARSKRSNQQNRYYHGCVIKIVRQGFKDLGYIMSPEETHEFLKDKFLDYEIMANSEGVEIGRKFKSTTELTKTEFCEYVDKIAQWSAEILNVVIPEPNTQIQLI